MDSALRPRVLHITEHRAFVEPIWPVDWLGEIATLFEKFVLRDFSFGQHRFDCNTAIGERLRVRIIS